MRIDGWKYYNHAAIPVTAPHKDPNPTPVLDGRIWKLDGKPLFARWSSDFDCGYETNWWYIIKDGPFVFEELSGKTRKHIRNSFKNVSVRQILMREYAEELCRVYQEACMRYKVFTGTLPTVETFLNANNDLDCWGIFSAETDRLIGYMTCFRGEGYVETITAKYTPECLNLLGSYAVHFTILDYYLNQEKYSYICSGTRSINHITNVQEYKISKFNFRKVYCRLHITYHPKIKWLIQLLYVFRKPLRMLDRIRFIHLINSVLSMEELCRADQH